MSTTESPPGGTDPTPSAADAASTGMHGDPVRGLYDPAFERDSCGFGVIANLDDQPSHWLVATALTSLTRLEHRMS